MQGGGAGTQVNFADFNSPVPASAYRCQPECGNSVGGMTNYCTTIYDNFNPQVAYPTDVFKNRPEWKSCRIEYLGNVIHDPPTALSPAAPATPTVPDDSGPTTLAQSGKPPVTPAKPTQDPTKPTTVPAEPNKDPPNPTKDPSDPSNSPPGNGDPPNDSPSPDPPSNENNNSPTGNDSPSNNNDEPLNDNHLPAYSNNLPSDSVSHNNSPGHDDNTEHNNDPSKDDPSAPNPAGKIIQIIEQNGPNANSDNSDPDDRQEPSASNDRQDQSSQKSQEDANPNHRDSLGATSPAGGAVLTISGQVYTATELPNRKLVIDGTTMDQGSPALTVHGAIVSAASKEVVVDGKTTRMSTLTGPKATQTDVAAISTVGPALDTSTKGSGGGRSAKLATIYVLMVEITVTAVLA